VSRNLRELLTDKNSLRGGMGLGSGSCFTESQPQVFQDSLDDLPVFDETDDAQDSPTLRAG